MEFNGVRVREQTVADLVAKVTGEQCTKDAVVSLDMDHWVRDTMRTSPVRRCRHPKVCLNGATMRNKTSTD